MTRRVCLSTFRKIINVQQALYRNGGRTELLLDDPIVQCDGHSATSLKWTTAQVDRLEKLGVEKWAETPAALGYAIWFKCNMIQ